MTTKTFLFAIFLLLTAGNNLPLLSQDSLDLEIVWQKEVFPKEIKFANFSADGQWIYAAIGNTIEKISAETGEYISVFSTEGISSGIYDMDISGLGNLILTRDGGGAINIWDTRLEKAVKYINSFTQSPGYDGIVSTAISPDETKMVLCVSQYKGGINFDYFVVIFDLILEKEIKRVSVTAKFNKIKFSHDGKYFATGGWYKDQWEDKNYDQVILWSTETWAPIDTIETLEGVGSGYTYLKFSKDDLLFGCTRRTPSDTRIYDLFTKSIIKNPGKNYPSFEILPDNEHFLFFFVHGNYDLELHNRIEKIHSYSIPTDIIDVFNDNDNWKIICAAGNYPITMLSKKPIGIDTEPKLKEIITISFLNNNIIIQTENIYEDSLITEIYDLQSKIVFSQTFENTNPNNRITIPMHLNSGIYFCKVKAGDKEYSQKIEIVR